MMRWELGLIMVCYTYDTNSNNRYSNQKRDQKKLICPKGYCRSIIDTSIHLVHYSRVPIPKITIAYDTKKIVYFEYNLVLTKFLPV
ncbi:hypothetical protein Hanom_Chr06g00569321 [Helianthus anomalus]